MHIAVPKYALGLLLFAAAYAGMRAAENPSTEFYTAIRANDLARVNALLSGGGSANVHDARGVTPLMYAAVVGSVEAMSLLVDAGADVNARNDVGSTALIWSATDLARVKLLIEHGANVNAATDRGRTPLLVAAMADRSADVVRFLVSKGANVHAVDNVKMSALHAATMGGDAGTVRMLIDAGVAIDTSDAGGYTPLINAAQHGNVRAVEMLLAKGANVNAVCAMGDMQSHVSTRVKNGPLGLGRFTPLLAAAPYGPASLIEALVRAGADVNARDSRGLTPLMLAVATDHADPRTITTLIAAGTDVKAIGRANRGKRQSSRCSPVPAQSRRRRARRRFHRPRRPTCGQRSSGASSSSSVRAGSSLPRAAVWRATRRTSPTWQSPQRAAAASGSTRMRPPSV